MVVCAWCHGKISGNGAAPRRTRGRGRAVHGHSHGICPSCAAAQLERMARRAGAAPALALR